MSVGSELCVSSWVDASAVFVPVWDRFELESLFVRWVEVRVEVRVCCVVEAWVNRVVFVCESAVFWEVLCVGELYDSGGLFVVGQL